MCAVDPTRNSRIGKIEPILDRLDQGPVESDPHRAHTEIPQPLKRRALEELHGRDDTVIGMPRCCRRRERDDQCGNRREQWLHAGSRFRFSTLWTPRQL